MQAVIIQGAAAAKAKLVVAENLYMYGQVSGPISETLPVHPTTRKGHVRAQMAEDLMAAHQAGIVRATSGRASDFYGPEAGAQGAPATGSSHPCFPASLCRWWASWTCPIPIPMSAISGRGWCCWALTRKRWARPGIFPMPQR